ncbi:hypothetical protein UFOVP130_59 [uncultured Caudovirales phage]|uniref:Uncharacterized protein n=1 Tax=uncultured Caudovirales phage TaxID=2100421 RepID=A0A6J5L9B6_9CAUD|nr:hypothetical protein UFOVP130_59 [uncultured Caudovirales phage]
MAIDWSALAAEAGGATGVLAIVLSFLKHMPAPKCGSVAYRWVFDSVQDWAKNHERIGEVRKDCSAIAEAEHQ